jgi:hypothetical protein
MNDMIANNLTEVVNTDPFLLFFGTFYLVLGMSILLATRQWKEFIALFIKNESLPLVFGVLTLPISLFVVFFYNNWTDLAPIILMVLGYIGLLKALVLLLRPTWVQAWVSRDFVNRWLWLDGVSGIILGASMLLL